LVTAFTFPGRTARGSPLRESEFLMPAHRVRMDLIEEEVERIERTERILAIQQAGTGAFIIITEAKTQRAKPGEKETR